MIDWTEEKIHALLRDLKTAASDQEALDWLNERVEQGGFSGRTVLLSSAEIIRYS